MTSFHHSISLSTLTAISITIVAINFLYTHLFSTKHPLFAQRATTSTTSHPWAFITASSSGIGYGIARSLLTQKFNIILHGRNPTRLQHAVETLSKAFPNQQITSICFDVSTALTVQGLSSDCLNALSPLTNPSNGIDLRLLINNVGVAFDPNSNADFASFTSQSIAHVTHNIDVNVRFATLLTHHLLPLLRRNAETSSGHGKVEGKRSIILNISSLASMGIPYFTVYSAAKAYMTTFSRALDTEMKAEKWPVDVKVVECGDVDTPGHKVGQNMFTPSADEMGRMIVDAVMDERSEVVLYPFWGHRVLKLACVVQPFWLLQKGMILNLKQNMKQRQSKGAEKRK